MSFNQHCTGFLRNPVRDNKCSEFIPRHKNTTLLNTRTNTDFLTVGETSYKSIPVNDGVSRKVLYGPKGQLELVDSS